MCPVPPRERGFRFSHLSQVAVLYVEAVAIFEEMLGPKCKEVTQLHAWISVAYMWMNNFDGAMKRNKLVRAASRFSASESPALLSLLSVHACAGCVTRACR